MKKENSIILFHQKKVRRHWDVVMVPSLASRIFRSFVWIAASDLDFCIKGSRNEPLASYDSATEVIKNA